MKLNCVRVGLALLVAFLVIVEKSDAQGKPLYFINSPNVLRVEASEKISLSVQNVATPVKIQLYLQDYPGRKKTFSQKEVEVKRGTPQIVDVKVSANDIPLPSKPGDKQYVYLVAKSTSAGLKFQKEARILLSRKTRAVFMQTDKPIYTPTQTVRLRIIPVGIDLKPFSAGGVTVEIRNPDGKIVERYDRLFSRIGYMVESIKLGDTPLIGNWTVSAVHEKENTSITFEVREYVLPRFSVEIVGPAYVLQSDKEITVKVDAKYVYGKAVNGRVLLKVGIINDRSEIIHLTNVRDTLDDGKATFRLPTSIIKQMDNGIWFPDNDRLNLVASVTERASGQVETSTDTSIHFSATPFRITFKRSMLYFKPGLPFEAQIDVKYPSKRPAAKRKIKVTGTALDAKNKPTDLTAYGDKGLEAITDEDGRTKITVDVPADAVSIVVKAKVAASENIADEFNKEAIFKASPYQSSSKSYTLVRSPEVVPKVGEATEVEVFIVTSKAIKEVQYMVLSRGKLLLSKTYNDPGAITVLRFKTTPEMCPSMRVVVYYTLESNGKTEIVSDFTVVDVKDEFKNKVSIETTKKEERPGADTVVTIKGTPNSYAAILAVDKSIYILRDSHKLTSEVVFRGLKKFDLGCGPGGGKDSQDVFKNAGITTITNADLRPETRGEYSCGAGVLSRARRSVEGAQCCEEGKKARKNPKSCILQARNKNLEELCEKLFVKCCKGQALQGRSFGIEEEEDDDIFEDDRKVQFRSNFPETWLFGDVVIGKTGIATMKVKVPDTITTWVMQAFATNTQTGLGVATSYELVAFKPFFVQLNLPYSMIRNEQIMLSATVYNFGKSRSTTRVYMRGEEGLCYDSREKRRSTPQLLRIEANDAATLRFPMIPLELGERNVTVIAYTSDGGDAVTRPIRIEPEGVEQVKTLSEFIDPSSAAGSRTQQTTISVDLPADAIPGSESATFFVTGDLLGPIVTKLLKNVQKALRNPVEVYQVSATETFTVSVPQTYTYTLMETYTQYYRTYQSSCACNIRNGGCLRSRAAQRQKVATGTRQVQRTRTKTVWRQRDRFVLQGMAPNVYVLQYLKRTNQLTDAVKKQAEGYIAESYRRLLGHRTKDGSFSMWGNTAAGDLWLTAFIAGNLQDASEFVQIDSSVICQAAEYLIKSQKNTGAFLEEGQSFSKGMMGGTNGDPAMTAFVLISLLNVNCGAMTMKIALAAEKAQEYLQRKLPTMKRAYDLAITSYALALANSQSATTALAALEKIAIKDKVKKTVYWKENTESVTIEATSYALLALLFKEKLTYSKAIIKWLTEHRNAEGGFSSGQDTVIGLKAISAYGGIQPALNLGIQVKSTADPAFRQRYFITKRNALVQHSVELPVGGDVIVTSRGVGTAEVQIELHYNIPRPKEDKCPFTTKLKIDEISSKNDYSYKMEICARYIGKGDVGMSVMEIGVLTGFVPIQESFEKMLAASKIKRYELSDRAMVVYFDKMKKDSDTCVSVSFKRAFDVGVVQPVPIVVKDFLEQSISCTTMYSLSGKSPVMKKICKGTQCRCTQERCSSCRPTRMRSSFCKKDFAGLFKIKSSKKEGAWTVFSGKVMTIYRGSEIFKTRDVNLWVGSGCNCPKFVMRRTYLIMSMGGDRLVLNDQSFVRMFPRRKKEKNEYNKLNAVLMGLKARC